MKKPITDKLKRAQRREQALASLALEDIYPSTETLYDLDLLSAGQITMDEYKARLFKRTATRRHES